MNHIPGPWKWRSEVVNGERVITLGGDIHVALAISGKDLSFSCLQGDQNILSTSWEMYELLKDLYVEGNTCKANLAIKALLDKIDY